MHDSSTGTKKGFLAVAFQVAISTVSLHQGIITEKKERKPCFAFWLPVCHIQDCASYIVPTPRFKNSGNQETKECFPLWLPGCRSEDLVAF